MKTIYFKTPEGVYIEILKDGSERIHPEGLEDRLETEKTRLLKKKAEWDREEPFAAEIPEWEIQDYIPKQDPRQVRDAALAALVHDLGDGRVIQCRPHPFSDESNMRNAIEQMTRLGQETRLWFAADNIGVMVTSAELQATIESGQDQSAEIWNKFFSTIQE